MRMKLQPADIAPRRAEWLRVLARAQAAELVRRTAPIVPHYRFEALRAPEEGLFMVRARIGNHGDRFNVGEATVTRCVVRHRAMDDAAFVGVGYVLGRDGERAERAAQMDALLQRPDLHALLWRDVIEPLLAARAQRDHDERARTEASRVRFFTLQPEAT